MILDLMATKMQMKQDVILVKLKTTINRVAWSRKESNKLIITLKKIANP